MRRQSFQRERTHSMRAKASWGGFAQPGEDSALLGDEESDAFYDEPGYTRPLLFSCCVALISAFQFGYNTGITGALTPDLVFPGHTNFQWSLAVSSFAIGGPIGSILAGRISTHLGRKRALIIDAALFIIAGFIMMFAVHIYMLILGRWLVGFAAGMVSVIVPMYLGELAPPNLRGALGTGYQFGVVLGILAADGLGFVFSGPSVGFSQPGWRGMFGFTIIPALVQIALASWLSESPRWLLTQNEPKQAADILRRLRGMNDVYEEIDSICSASDSETSNVSVFRVLCDRSIRYALIVGIGLQIAQQLSGINAVIFYANSFFDNIGVANPLVGTTLVGTVNVVSTGVALILMDRVGRRPLLLWSVAGMFFSAIVLTAALLHWLPASSTISVGAMMSYVWFFEIGLGPIPWLIVAEMFPAQPRPTAMSVATMVNWICSFIIGIGFPLLQSTLADFSFIPFAAVLLASYVFIARFVPETKGKTLEEIQRELAENN